MRDPRDTPFNGRVAHVSLRGKLEAEKFVDGETCRAKAVTAPICAKPGGPRERELILGEAFRVLDILPGGGWAYGFAERDGYAGWIEAAQLADGAACEPTHRVAAIRTYGKGRPELKSTEPVTYLPFGALVHVTETTGTWARIPWQDGSRCLFAPAQHLVPLSSQADDPVFVARQFLGTPYLWGGNSAFGLDCSGLVQAAMLACGIPCPGDSDQQRARLGDKIGMDDGRRPGDLYFWEGHVGILSDASTLLHANAHHMAVAEEPLEAAIARIAAKDGKPVLCRRRVARASVNPPRE